MKISSRSASLGRNSYAKRDLAASGESESDLEISITEPDFAVRRFRSFEAHTYCAGCIVSGGTIYASIARVRVCGHVDST